MRIDNHPMMIKQRELIKGLYSKREKAIHRKCFKEMRLLDKRIEKEQEELEEARLWLRKSGYED